jgi:glycosyltransferase involved in cell wall biosynthesis
VSFRPSALREEDEADRSPAPIAARAAVVHDWFQGFHGSERTVAAMLDLFAHDPDIFTFHAARELLPARLAAAIVRESRLARFPGIRQRGHDPGRWRWLLPYMPHYFWRLDITGYEVVISSSHACAAGVRTSPESLHVCYCYTPMRYAWMPEAERGRVQGVKGLALASLRGRLKAWDRRAAQRPDVYVAISTAVAERIARFYGRDAFVISPPVAIGDVPHDVERDPTHFLWVHRLVGYKRPLEVAAAFRDLSDLRLTMVGVGPLERELREALPPNVELLGWLPRERLARLYAGAAGFIHVGEEDFGISMVEALAAGTPVLAVDRGGARDIVRPGVDGVLITGPADPARVRQGVLELARGRWDRRRLREGAERFSGERFRNRMADLLRAAGAS